MRRIKALVLAAGAALLAIALAQPASAQVSFDLAYSNLSEHGSWLVSAQYGRVWQPREYTPEWNPYYDGHWTDTDMGWAWVSDYEWGSIPYHYGTWVADSEAGWVWIPGDTWAPSWVVFRTGPDYIGWAPVAPGFSVGASIELGGSSGFIFVSSRDFLAPSLRVSIIPEARSRVFVSNTTVVNNIRIENNVVVNRGPDVAYVEKATGHPVRQERIESVARVAPFQNVSRAQLSVAPERMKNGVRAAEQVPASRPLPVSDKRALSEPNTPSADKSNAQNGREADRPKAKERAIDPGGVMSSKAAETPQEARSSQSPPFDAAAAATVEANAKAKADQNTKAQANAKANAAQNAKAQANARATAQQTARAQANAKAKADQVAKAEAASKAKADAKARKHIPDKQDPNSGKGAASETSEGTHP